MSYFKLGKCENYRSKKENYRSRCLYFLYIVILDGIYIYTLKYVIKKVQLLHKKYWKII